MRPRPLAAPLLTLACSAAACQLVWSYDNFKDQPGTGGSAPSSSSSSSSSGGGSTASSSAASSSGCTTDDDMDSFVSWTCDPTDPTLDCADEDARAFPGAGFAPSPIMGPTRPGTQSWDFDCNGQITAQTPIQGCGGFLWCAGGIGYQPGIEPECGGVYPLGSCTANGWFFACQWTPLNPPVSQVQQCK